MMDFTTLLVPALDSQAASMYETRESELSVENMQELNRANIDLGIYDNLVWDSALAHSVLNDAVSWGTKTLPGAGPFYFANYSEADSVIDHL